MVDQKYFIRQLGKDRYVAEAVQRLLTEQAVPEALSASQELAGVRDFLAAYQDNEEKNGFIIINSDLINIASMRDTDLGIPNLIAKDRPDLIRRVFLGETVFIPPFRSAATSLLPPSVFFAAPVIDQADRIIAAIIVCLDPTKSFSRIIQLSRLSESGETYAFNKRGELLSESRFTSQLREMGLIKPHEKAILNIRITDPGRNLLPEQGGESRKNRQAAPEPYTVMAESALRGESGENMNGYRDYRGVLVYGVWRWDDALGFGLATEIDVHEALGPYLLLRKTVFAVLAVVLFSAAAGILFTLIFGERAYRLMRAAQGHLEEQVERRTEELWENEKNLRRALKISKAATRAKSTFLSNMSHEIRTPMNAIIGFTDIVLQTDLNEIQRRHLNTVSRSARSLLSLLNDILDLSKIEEGKVELKEMIFMLPKIIEEVFATLGMKAREKKITLHLRYDEGLPNCFVGDDIRLKQVLMNLLDNAIKFTENGSVTLYVTPAEKKGFLHFMVKDTGIGIASGRLETIFSPFAQADASTTRKHGGTGLGTTISRQIVECMSGKIWAESEESKGSVFHFVVRLPEGECITPCATGEIRADVEFRATKSLHILLVEDIPENVELATLRLAAVGHRVDVASNGREAVQMVVEKKEAYHLILMDVHMPEMDGLEACKAIRKSEDDTGGRIPIIALSASVLEEEKNYCWQAGMDGFIGKPIDFTELFFEISRIVPKNEGSPLDDLEITPGNRGRTLPQLPGLDTESGIRLWRDTELYLRSLHRFVEKHGKDGELIRQALAKDDLKTAGEISHSLKGVAGNLGVIDVAATASRLNEELKKMKGDFYPGANELVNALEIAVGSIRGMDNQTRKVRKKILTGCDLGVMKKLLTDLLHALDRVDLDRVESLLEQLEECCTESQLTVLAQQVADFEFRAAEETLKELASMFSINLGRQNDEQKNSYR
ncbi:MAG: ATP-binding protein [Candidatus Electrothrix communis]|nr:MAG: ATP-binding protein [Candidatus Electrothrix communis]